ncbi:bifunctional heparan sulfate N-deacetylase/N-sulfotransferase 3-like [Saccostrea cucullata]|uniref:bifunctional heparan sulfate N-deacetylase/N-sulfotransferase 3-like n=1 Tax=Saccostrea cuccullata TaxID=36930 RepID=UPI002ED26593
MKLNWKFKFCCLIAVVLVTSILYELWFVGGKKKLFYKPVSRQSSKDIFSFSLSQQHELYQKDDMFNNIFFSAEDVTDFILLILKNENVMVTLQTLWEKYSRDKGKLLNDQIKNEKFENKANIMLRDILNKKNKNVFLDVNEKYEFSVLNRTCHNIERDLQGRGQCIVSLEDTLCSERKLSDRTKGKKQKNRSQQKWTGQKEKLCDYMHMNSSTFVYLPHLKNPCYEECERGYNTIRCLPYFMIIGMPKSGTTSLYYHLAQHKEVLPGKKKEPMYFNRNCYRGMHLNDYTMNFDEMKTRLTAGKQVSSLITGDGSADVAFDSWDWKNFPGNEGLKEPKYVLPFFIHKLLPGLKIIIMLRDPVERLYSDYLFEAPIAHYLLSLEDFHQAVHRAVRKQELCQAQFSVRTCAYNSSLENYKARLRVGMYYVFLMDWLNIYPQNQILVIDFDEYTKDKRKILNEVAEFLELSK